MQTPAKLYAGVIGTVLVLAGIIGFLYSTSFGSPGEVDAVLGILDVNAWHNLVHIITGALGLIALRYAARPYALGLGAVYVVVAVWGFVIGSGHDILGFLPINTEDNILHLLLGVAGLAAGMASSARRVVAPPRAAAASS